MPFGPRRCSEHLNQLTAGNSAGEYYLTDMAQFWRSRRSGWWPCSARCRRSAGREHHPELVALDATLRAQTALRLMLEGVTIFRPETCVIDADVEVGPDTVIEPLCNCWAERASARIA
jgi:bifunctional UDP-N-acetylglucosamine pyrophosphorylase/glucosamine-1-phosphate N-acetyltransferase